METSTEIETKILNSFEQMIDNLTSEKDLDDKVNITNIQSAVDNILNEISGDPRNGFKKGNKLSEKGYNWPEIGDNWPEKATTDGLGNETLSKSLFPLSLLPNEPFPGTLKLNSHGKIDVKFMLGIHRLAL